MPETTHFTAKKKSLVAALMVAVFLAAMETTITVLALPTIAQDLAGFDLMSLVFSSYLFISAIATPFFGRLADAFGRKRVLIVGVAIFLVGSILCGLSQSMLMLVSFRALQGIGAGAIFTLSYTIVGDAFPLESRGPIMGAMASVWGVAGLAGPLLGGVLIDTLSWHWVFFINVPFGIVSIILLQVSLKESHASKVENSKQSADRSGLFTRVTVLVNTVTFLACVSMVGVDVYVALFLQRVLGYSPTIAGLSVLPMAITWFITSTFMGKLLTHFNAKHVVIASGIMQLLCGALLISFNETTNLPFVIFAVTLTGVGLGGLLTSTTIIIQESVGYSQRGTAMGINSFVKSISQAIGITVLGVFLNMRLISFFEEQGLSSVDVSALLQTENNIGATPAATEATMEPSFDLIVTALDSGIDLLFWIMFACTVLLVIIALFIPRLQLGSEEAKSN